MITIIDYGIGNLRSIEKAFESVGVDVLRTDRPDDLAAAERLVLPGVGAFGACADEIRRRGLEAPIRQAAAAGTPLLGVCVGLQLLFDVSEEMGEHRGLGLLPGRVVRFPDSVALETAPPAATLEAVSIGDAAGRPAVPEQPGRRLKIPHMGWNTLSPTRATPLLDGLDEGAFFYFVHSYHAVPARPEDVLARTAYGTRFASVVGRNNVFGVQFHPEKSQRNGLRILKNFAGL